jgi:hypothetical protein
MRFCTSLAKLPGIEWLAGRSIHGVRPASAVQGAAVQSNGAATGGVAVPAGGPLVWIDTPRKLTTEPEGSFSEIRLGTP